MTHPTTVEVDWTACQSHGLCAELLPDHITLDEWGYPQLPETPLSPTTLPRAHKATKACPTLALKLRPGQPT
ncbi:ferredoxin [Streptomyces sp. NPDC094437]|uniref:ferredoxin n=1 Tax=Streptomyces sp. NPDC094437 TaxID=3366060 RepID=UPI00381D4A86